MSDFAAQMSFLGQSGLRGDAAHRRSTALSPFAERIARQQTSKRFSIDIISGLVRVVDGVGLAAIATAVMLIYVGIHLPVAYAFTICTGSVLFVLLNEYSGGYSIEALKSPRRSFGRVALSWTATCALLTLAGFLLKTSEDFSRVWFGSWYFSGLAFLFIAHAATGACLKKWTREGLLARRAVIVGGGERAEGLIRALEKERDSNIHICGIFDDRDDERSPPIIAGYPKLGDTEQLLSFARQAHIDLLIISLPLQAEERMLKTLKKLGILPVDIRLSALSNRVKFRPSTYSYFGSVPMFNVLDRPIGDWNTVTKRIFDVVFSMLGILAFLPIMAMAAIAIKLDSPGPILFRQKRHGFNNEEIEVFKFRSMYADRCDPTARNPVTRNDSRVTRVGRFIRKFSIDELPQFFNVLRGEMSLVGPRPHAVAAQANDRLFTEVVDGYFARHRVKPGITGWAQVNGWRGEIDSDEKISSRTQYDLYYIENWSIWFDLRILLTTPISLFRSDGAY
ncbi:undecaprenyl-phosphate glucose phosphotransferase [Oricola sp.]|uniref:undecaprenyl-phosphate glucose phosphotransferase n=1 Tax=Oricola sp. TaxID=1979950 RepID=UPI00320BBB83|nr:undecaprenyl-phosphate glucose phosphotransferase [Oricola sp.]